MKRANCLRAAPALTSTAVTAVLLCLALTVGALSAFWDHTSNGQNRIQTGFLSAALWGSHTLSPDGSLDNRFSLSDPSNKLFDGVDWVPGMQCVRYLQVENTGTLPLSYTVSFSMRDQQLGEHLIFAIRPMEGCGGSLSPDSEHLVRGNEIETVRLQNSSLPPGYSNDIYEITCKMEEWEASYGRTSPDLRYDLDITLLVTQTGMPPSGGAVLASCWDDLRNAAPFGTILLTRDIHAPQEDLALHYPVNFDLNGHTLTIKSLHITDPDSSGRGMIGFRNGTLAATGQVLNSGYGIVVDAPQMQVHFSGINGIVFANGVVYEDGIPQEEAEAPPLTDGVYRIFHRRHLLWLSQQVNGGESFAAKEFQLMGDIDLYSMDWIPIGWQDAPNAAEFSGIFNGNGFTIRNLSIHREGSSLGLFGAVSGAVRNLSLEGVTISGADQVAALSGKCSGSVENCTVQNAKLSGHSRVGGLLGSSSGPVSGCSVINSVISGSGSSVGGLVGSTEEGDVSFLENAVSGCTITGFSDAGGLIGIKECSVRVLRCHVSDSQITINAGASPQFVYCGSLIGRAREFYMMDPRESEERYAETVVDNEIGAQVTVTANGSNALFNQYPPYTGVLEPVEW
ncbi:MAG: hypothetical protein HFE39_03295 [Clostridiales bacterium]|jgi:hypothetical protein|nr:hypothetical protein [Clostridiales bacterium]